MFRTTIILALATTIYSHDLTVGLNNEGRNIYNQTHEASPAIWRQIQNVTVNTTDPEVISKIVVTDLRPYKDGEAKIVEGGEGKKSVTIELKSPTALRGYDFHVEVYSIKDKNAQGVEKGNKDLEQTSSTRIVRSTNAPDNKPKQFLTTDDEANNTTPRGVTDGGHINIPVSVGVKDNTPSSDRKSRDTEKDTPRKLISNESNTTETTRLTTVVASTTENIPKINNDLFKPKRDTQNENVPVSTGKEDTVSVFPPKFNFLPGLVPQNSNNGGVTSTQKSVDPSKNLRKPEEKVNATETPEVIDGNTTLKADINKNAENITGARDSRDTQGPRKVIDVVERGTMQPEILGETTTVTYKDESTLTNRYTAPTWITSHTTENNKMNIDITANKGKPEERQGAKIGESKPIISVQ